MLDAPAQTELSRVTGASSPARSVGQLTESRYVRGTHITWAVTVVLADLTRSILKIPLCTLLI